MHGLDGNVVGPDGTFSQGAVKVSQAANLIAAVNVSIRDDSLLNDTSDARFLAWIKHDFALPD